MRLKAISALTVFTTAMIVAFADGHSPDPGQGTPNAIGGASHIDNLNFLLAT